MRRRSLLALPVCALALVGLPSAAFAGGTQVEVAAVGGAVWVTTGSGIAELKAATGHVVRRYRARYPYPIDIGVSDGSVWVSSVENGFWAGAVTRIPSGARGRVTQPLVFPSRPVLALAVGSSKTWALVGPWASLRLATIDQATGKSSLRPIRHDVGWIAADNTGRTPGLFGVTGSGQAIGLAPDGRTAWTAATDAITSPPVAGLGKLWVASRTGLYRLNATTGRIEAKIALRDAAAELAVGGGFVWLLSFRTAGAGPQRYELFKIDPRTARIVSRTKVNGPVGGLSFGDGALWLGRDVPSVAVVRIDPRTLRARLFATNRDH